MESARLYVGGLVAYDGTDYYGFQYQVGVPTIQNALEEALASFLHAESRVVGAGRTDRGVHASGQVVAVKVRWRHSMRQLQRAWNHYLPASICVRQVRQLPEHFFPRFSAVWRTYRYTVIECCEDAGRGNESGDEHVLVRTPPRSPLTDRYAFFVKHRLDVEAMQKAADVLVGTHDFVSFGQPTQGDVTIRKVREATWAEDVSSVPMLTAESSRRLVFTITANGFLRQMVRRVVSSLLAVGMGDWDVAALGEVLAVQDRSRSRPPVPANGLVLEKVEYPDDLAFFC